MATAKFEVAADLWPQVVSKPGEPLRVVEHRKGDVVDVDPDQYANLVEAGALVKQVDAQARRRAAKAPAEKQDAEKELAAQRKAREAESKDKGDQSGDDAEGATSGGSNA